MKFYTLSLINSITEEGYVKIITEQEIPARFCYDIPKGVNKSKTIVNCDTCSGGMNMYTLTRVR